MSLTFSVTATDVWGVPVGPVSLVVVVTLSLALFNTAPRIYEAWAGTFGRRRILYRRVERLAPNVRQEYFTDVLKMVPAIAVERSVEFPDFSHADYLDESRPDPKTNAKLTELIWVDRLFFVQAMTDNNDVVLGYAVTTRHPKFRPAFSAPLGVARPRWLWSADQAFFRIKLGKTKFSQISGEHVRLPKVWITGGASWADYSEQYDFARPGGFAEYVCATGSNTPVMTQYPLVPGKPLVPQWEAHSEQYGPRTSAGEPTLADWLVPHRDRVVTTWAVTTMPLQAHLWPSATWGPEFTRVQLVP